MKEVIVTIKHGLDDKPIFKRRCQSKGSYIYLDSDEKDMIIFLNDSLTIYKEGPEYRSEILLKENECKGAVYYDDKMMDLNVILKRLIFEEDYIYALYDTGELIELRIDFI